MKRSLNLLLPVLLLSACDRTGGKLETKEFFPVVNADQTTLEFGSVAWGEAVTQTIVIQNRGDLAMGVGEIWIGEDGMEDNWAMEVDWAAMRCPGDSDDGSSDSGTGGDGSTGGDDGGTGGDDGGTGGDDGGTGGTDSGGDGGSTGDSGDGGSTGDTGGGSDSAAPEGPSPAPAPADTGDWYGDGGGSGGDDEPEVGESLGPDCTVPVRVTLTPERIGDIYGSLHVETLTETVRSDDAEPTYWADPDNTQLVAILHGSADKGAPDIYIRPRALNFGHLWAGESEAMLVDIQNTGEGDLTIESVYLDESCSDGFTITQGVDAGETVRGGAKTYAEVTFAPDDDSSASCTLWIESDDPDEPRVDVPMQGNTGSDPTDCAPTAVFISPDIGYQHLDGGDLPIEFKVSDCNQTADTLDVQVRSGVQWPDNPVLVDTFNPPDESGYVALEIDRDKLGRGTDTIIVRVKDEGGNRAYASTTILWRDGYPDSDDDGDGYGTDDPKSLAYDCDDSNINTFPGAVEVYDGADNDCDGEIDEETEGTDDDLDGWTEIDGDCDDANADSNPDAEEVPDYLDNDCDGDIDENTTLSDDDGDGYAEADGDCNDSDASVGPTAIEYCDGIDNDCNGLSDEQDGCVDLSAAPMIIGGVQVDRDAISVGQTATMTVLVYDPDGEPTSYAWTQDAKLTQAGYPGLDSQASATVTFTAPAELPGGAEKQTYTFLVQVSDPGGRQDFDSIDIVVTAEPVELSRITETSVGGGCSKSSGSSDDTGAAALLIPGALLGLLALGRRRREDD